MATVTAEQTESRIHYLAGLRQFSAGDIPAAIATLRIALMLDPTHPGPRRNLIRALLAAGQHASVIAETIEAIQQSPDDAELHYMRGTAFNALSHPREAREALTAAIALNPRLAPAWLNLGNACMDLDETATAEAHCRRALRLDPAMIEARISLGHMLTAQGRMTEAIEVLKAAIRIRPDNVRAHWNLATALLLSGDLPRGFAEDQWRKWHDLYHRDFVNLPGPTWNGANPRGRTILVHAEQGLGDTIQFARYLSLIAQRGGTPVLACEPSLIPLLSTIQGARIVSKHDPLPRYDAWIDQMSLPHVFATTLATIPTPASYLTADPALTALHRATMPPTPRIGLVWAGNPLHRNDRRRTPPPELFAALTALPDCHFVSLVPGQTLPGVASPARPLTDFAETAALIEALDLVITVDTSVAHLAGALGCPAWVLLPHAPDWRWLMNRNDTPWYDQLQLFRQPSPGDWASVIASLPDCRSPRSAAIVTPPERLRYASG